MNHNQAVGGFGEQLAAQFLIKRGYKVIDRNIKTSFKEIDLIALYEGLLIFIEVKTRTSNKLGFAEEMMSSKKINNLKQAASRYLSYQKNKYKNLRFDFIAVDINVRKKIARIKHFKDIL